MADSKAPEAVASFTSLSTLEVQQQQRRVIADVISSPELPLGSFRSNTAHAKKLDERRPVDSSGKIHSRSRQNLQQPTARKLMSDVLDDAPIPEISTCVATASATPSDRETDISCNSGRDSLLERLREKEKQFDEKITALDETLQCAERGQAQRDHIIDALRAEVGRLRAQLEIAAVAKSQTDELREKLLRERTAALEEARAKIEELSAGLSEKELRVRRLEKELRARQLERELRGREAAAVAIPESRAASTTVVERSRLPHRRPRRKEKKEEEQELVIMSGSKNDSLKELEEERRKRERERERYTAGLRKLQDEVQALEQSYKVSRKEKDALTVENSALRCKLEAIHNSMEARAAKAIKAVQNNTNQMREIEAEVVATRLSMARLLRLLSEVPEMRQYMRVNDVDGDIIFAGYATSALAPGAKATSSELVQHLPRRRNGGLLVAAPSTGVDDGIYGGNLLLQSYNIYLNGQWCKQLHDIINDENYFLRRAKINICELEDAGRCGRGGGDAAPRVPEPSDVLQGRQRDKDFWIPYQVFVEAQKFKNRHFPSLSYENFYPFFIAVNRVWDEKLKRRVASEIQRRLNDQKRRQEKRLGTGKEPMSEVFSFSKHPQDLSVSALTLWRRLQELRRDVRRRVTGKNSLELFYLYDQLTRCALHHLQAVQVEHDRLLEQHPHHCSFEESYTELDFGEKVEDGKRERRWKKEDSSINKCWIEKTEDECDDGKNKRYSDDSERIFFLQQVFTTLAKEVQEVNKRAASCIGTSCSDMRQFLEALREQQLRMEWSQELSRQQNKENKWQQELNKEDGLTSSHVKEKKADGCVSSCTLLCIIDGVLGFVGEVQREITTAERAALRCVEQANEYVKSLFTISRGVDGVSEDTEADETEAEDDGDFSEDQRYYYC